VSALAAHDRSARPARHTVHPAAVLEHGGVGLALLLMAAYTLLPLVWLVFASTKGNQTLYSTPGFWFAPTNEFFTNVHWLLSYDGGIFVRWVLNSILYATVTASLATLIAAMAGFAFAKYDFLGKRVIFTLILGSLMVPSAALVIPTFLFVKALGLIDTYAGVIIPLLVSPFGVYFMRVYIAGTVPDELLDAGRIDGASEVALFRAVVLRVITPGLITLFLISFVGIWNNFFLPLVVLSDEHLFPLTLGLALWNSTATNAASGQPLYPLVITGALFSIVPLIVLFLYLRRYIMTGLFLGSLK
jgi:multiple sugar transport system permease protein